MPIRVRLVTPGVLTKGAKLGDLAFLGDEQVSIERVSLRVGPTSVESEIDIALAAPDTVRCVLDAERDGADAAVIDCVCDPGIDASREVVSIPVVGPGQTAFHAAAMLSERFSIIVELAQLVPITLRQLHRHGLADRLASIRVVDMPVMELRRDRAKLKKRLAQEAVLAVNSDGAQLIVLGCTGMTGCVEAIGNALVAKGLAGVPVIDPLPLAIHSAVTLVRAKLSHSRLAYRTPEHKPVSGSSISGLPGSVSKGRHR